MAVQDYPHVRITGQLPTSRPVLAHVRWQRRRVRDVRDTRSRDGRCRTPRLIQQSARPAIALVYTSRDGKPIDGVGVLWSDFSACLHCQVDLSCKIYETNEQSQNREPTSMLPSLHHNHIIRFQRLSSYYRKETESQEPSGAFSNQSGCWIATRHLSKSARVKKRSVATN